METNNIQRKRILDCFDIEKSHKYIRKEMDGKGSYRYVYKEKEEKYAKVKEYTKQIFQRSRAIERLSQKEEQGRMLSGRRNVEATILIGSDERASSPNRSADERRLAQEELLEDYARKEGVWMERLPEIRPGNFVASGAEAKVYSYGSRSVVKVNNLSAHEEPIEFLDRIALHNHLFPDTKYEVLGFNRTGKDFSILVKQPFIQALEGADRWTVAEEMRKMGFAHKGGDTYVSDDYIVEDLHRGNVLIAEDGTLLFIDPIIYLNTKDEDFGGKREHGKIKL